MSKPAGVGRIRPYHARPSAERFGSATVAELEAIFNEAVLASGAAGSQASVILGAQRADFAFGSANTELGLPMTTDTVVQVGSVTKLFNAAVIMTLVEVGKLDLDTPVINYIPDLELADKNAQATITLRQLLSMSAGLDNGHTNPLKGDGALARYVGLLRDIPQVFPPGQGFGYSSAGTNIAGYAAERVTGEPWQRLVEERIFGPGGLARSVISPDDLPFHRVSAGHAPAQPGQPTSVVRPWYFTQGGAPGGSTFATSAQDLASFGRLFVNQGRAANGRQVLSNAAVELMMTPTTAMPAAQKWGTNSQWGLGPYMSQWGDVVAWGHAGGNQSGGAQLVWFPQKQAVLAFTLNTIGAFDALTAQMFERFSLAAFGFAAPRLVVPATPLNVDDPERYVGTFVRNGMRYEISWDRAGLHYRELNHRLEQFADSLGGAAKGDLIPLGGDRFLVRLPPPAEAISVAFFGDDGEGRAANLVVPMFATRRLSA